MARRRGPTKGSPFSIRLSKATDRFVAAEARRTRRSKGAIVEALTEEAARMRRFPGIGFRDEDVNRRAWVTSTGLDVWEAIEMLQDFGSVEQMAKEMELDERLIKLAEAYYREYPEEIDELIALNRRPLSELLAEHPYLEVVSVD